MSSLWKSGPLRAASPGSLVRGNFYTFVRMLLGAPCSNRSAFHARKKGYSIAVEVTRHLPGPFQSEGLNFSSWRAPQEAPWLAVLSLWPRSNSPWHLLTGWSSLLAFSTKNPSSQHLQEHPHTLLRKCVKKRQKLITNSDLHTTTAECDGKSSPPGPGFPLFFLPSGSRFMCEIPSQLLPLAPTVVKRTS